MCTGIKWFFFFFFLWCIAGYQRQRMWLWLGRCLTSLGFGEKSLNASCAFHTLACLVQPHDSVAWLEISQVLIRSNPSSFCTCAGFTYRKSLAACNRSLHRSTCPFPCHWNRRFKYRGLRLSLRHGKGLHEVLCTAQWPRPDPSRFPSEPSCFCPCSGPVGGDTVQLTESHRD